MMHIKKCVIFTLTQNNMNILNLMITLRDIGLNENERLVILAVSGLNEPHTNDIVDMLGLCAGTINKIVKKLERLDVIKTYPVPFVSSAAGGRKKRILALTKNGKALIKGLEKSLA